MDARAVAGAIVLALSVAGTAAKAQVAREQVLAGRVVGPDSQSVAGATVRVMQGATTHVVRTDDAGRYRVGGMADGQWTAAVQAVGFVSFFERFAFAGPSMEREFRLKRVQTELDPVLVEGNWSGVRGFVSDDRDLATLAGARITVVSKTGERLETDSSGRFELERPAGSVVMLRVEREGYARRLVKVEVPERGAARLVVRMDTLYEPRNDFADWQDMQERLRTADNRSAFVGREEIEAMGAKGLGPALAATPSVTRSAIVVDSRACVFVNGVPKPEVTVAALSTMDVDFVEVYMKDSNMLRTLNARWPQGSLCGQPTDEMFTFGRDTYAQAVLVWTRPPRPVTR